MALGIEKNILLQRYTFDYKKDDLFLLCSDGLSDMIGDNDLQTILLKHRSLKLIAKSLVKTANKNGGKDNITAILIKI